MKVINWNPVYTYSCVICQKFVNFSEEPKDKHIVCSKSCEWKNIYQTLNSYPNETIKQLLLINFPKEPIPKKRLEGLKKLTKFFGSKK